MTDPKIVTRTLVARVDVSLWTDAQIGSLCTAFGEAGAAGSHPLVTPAITVVGAADPEITTWAEGPAGGRARSFNTRGCKVTITPSDAENDTEAAQLAIELAAAAVGITARWDALVAERDAAEQRAANAATRAEAAARLVPPRQPARMLGPACVRFDTQGRLWLLNKRESGWSSWGVVCDGWDDLFRRYAVVITATGKDEHGLWWVAEPAKDVTP